jgi:predicted DNA-binding transcriptional regulator YafY
MSDINTKSRFMKLKEILEYETDEEHELSIEDIISKLSNELGENFDKKAIKRDVEDLNQAGFEIIENFGKYGKKYYSHQYRKFELYELRLLIDAVLSAKFITKEESEKLISKIKSLTSIHHAKRLPSQIFFDQTVKGNYHQIKIDIDHIHTAVSKFKTIEFKYGKYNVNKDFVLNREGKTYHVEPYGLIWNNELYYLIGRFENEEFFRHYRVDRMRHVTVTNQSFKRTNMNLSEYVHKVFYMYAGEDEWIHIRFKNDLLNVIIDRFGLDAKIKPIDEEHFDLKTKATVSDGLVRWIMTWGSDAKVLAPNHLVENIKDESEKLFCSYNH